MGDYAAKIGQLLRLCYRDGIDPISLSDSVFTHYIGELRSEPSKRNPRQSSRTETSVLAIGRVWLDFLAFVGRFHGDISFVSDQGTIKACEKTYQSIARSGRKIAHTYLTHHSFGVPTRTRTRNPITIEQENRLRDASRCANTSIFVKKRRRCMLDLFHDTGGRRTEISRITIDDIMTAYDMSHPMLRLETLKRGGVVIRYIPVTKMLLHNILNFIDIDRRKIIKTVYKDGQDHRFLFISETTGRKLSSNYLYNEILNLKNLAGIKSQLCPHMFRHAFITNLFIQLIHRHRLTNEDEFRRALLNTETFKLEIIQWTGHLNSASVDTYLNLALRSVSNYTETLNSVHIIRAMDAYFSRECELSKALKEGLPIDEYTKALDLLKKLFQEDMSIAKTRINLDSV